MNNAIGVANAARVAQFVDSLAVRAAHTRIAYARDVETLAAMVGDESLVAITRAQVARCLATMHGRGLSGRSLARMLSAWRAFFRHLIEVESSIAENPCAGLKAPKSPKRLPAALSPEEAAKLVAIDDDDFLGLRDRAMFELAYSSGLRLSEIVGLDISGLDLAGGEVKVLGKGSRERLVPVGAAARDALGRWLEARARLTLVDARAVFVGSAGRRLSPRAIELRLARCSVRQGLTQHVHPHMLRHSFASHVLQSSGDLRAVQEMLGHASIASTQVYTHLDFQALAKVYDAAHPRARRRKPRTHDK